MQARPPAGRHRRTRAPAGGGAGRDPAGRADARSRDEGRRAPRRRAAYSPPSARSGALPVEQAFNNPGFDILSRRDGEDPIRIEVKARIAGAEDFFVTHNEVLTALNSAPRYRLALVRVDPRGPEHDEVRYLENPFAGFDAGDFDATGHRGKWDTTWARGREPF